MKGQNNKAEGTGTETHISNLQGQMVKFSLENGSLLRY